MSDSHTETKERNKGQFAKGNPGGPGNPHARQVARIRATLLAALEPATLYEVVCRLIERAVNGNLEAIKILLSYTIGRPGKSDDLVALLSEHYPPLGQEGQESGDRNQESEESRHQTAETVAARRHQTVETDTAPVGQVADLPKAPEDEAPRTSTAERRHQTVETAEVHGHQTGETATAHRHQTGQTVRAHRHQTGETARRGRQQTVQSARILTAGLAGGRQQTDKTAETPTAFLSMLGNVLERAFVSEPGSASEISLVK